ncbi:MAG TPA: antibiotic biosynthesis monooxygenase [Nitrospirae bacterium]|nr:antibiotic biosynthesis monooxygenase [bacterium BMS3Abin06]HDH12685.1 antibiotic biosynthesis monooxygenase [Nitrospirota bacterium]HDY99993.1 antibiotic biosynthesis monooxygenase [Nitrospirota bacterium]
MKEYVMIPFQVEEDKLEEAKKAINELISNVRENEPGTLLYKSLQLKKDPTSFVHFMVFADNASHMHHRTAKYVLEFVKKLYSLCPNEPYPIFLENFDSCGIALEP